MCFLQFLHRNVIIVNFMDNVFEVQYCHHWPTMLCLSRLLKFVIYNYYYYIPLSVAVFLVLHGFLNCVQSLCTISRLRTYSKKPQNTGKIVYQLKKGTSFN